jgi:hypothetical protein
MQLLMNIARKREAMATMLIESQVHLLILDVLRACGNEIGLHDANAPYVVYCLLTIMNLSQWVAAYEPLRSAGYATLLLPVVKVQQQHSVFCMVALCYLLGREENSDNAKQFRSNEQNMESVVDALSNTVSRKGGEGYVGYQYGIFTFQIISRAILTLSISDENKKFLGRQKVTVPLFKIVENFLAGGEGDSIGGGKQDPLSAEYAIEALLQLSFLHDSDEDLRASDLFPKTSAGSLAHFVDVVERAVSSVGLSAAAKVNAANLLSRLTVKEVEVGGVGPGVGAGVGGAMGVGGAQAVVEDQHTTHGKN